MLRNLHKIKWLDEVRECAQGKATHLLGLKEAVQNWAPKLSSQTLGMRCRHWAVGQKGGGLLPSLFYQPFGQDFGGKNKNFLVGLSEPREVLFFPHIHYTLGIKLERSQPQQPLISSENHKARKSKSGSRVWELLWTQVTAQLYIKFCAFPNYLLQKLSQCPRNNKKYPTKINCRCFYSSLNTSLCL